MTEDVLVSIKVSGIVLTLVVVVVVVLFVAKAPIIPNNIFKGYLGLLLLVQQVCLLQN